MVDDQVVFTTGQWSGLDVMDLVQPQGVGFLSRYVPGGALVAYASVSGDTAFLAAREAGVYLVSLEDEVQLDSIGVVATVGDVAACIAYG